jgi:hypothetical protein
MGVRFRDDNGYLEVDVEHALPVSEVTFWPRSRTSERGAVPKQSRDRQFGMQRSASLTILLCEQLRKVPRVRVTGERNIRPNGDMYLDSYSNIIATPMRRRTAN